MLSRHLTNGRPGPMDTDRCRHPTAPRDGKQMVALETNLSPFGMVHLIQTTRVTREVKFCFFYHFNMIRASQHVKPSA